MKNRKQLAYAAGKIQKRRKNLLVRCIGLTLLVFFAQSIMFAVADPSGTPMCVEMGGLSLVLLTMASVGNISQPSGRDTAPSQIGFKLWLTAREQIDDSVAFPTPNSNRELGTIPLIAGEKMHYFEGVENSLKYTGTGESGDVTPTFSKEIPIIIKYSTAALNFIENFTQKGFVLIWEICDTGEKEVVGTYCKPIILQKFEVKEDGDGKYITLTFGNKHWRQPLTYVGDIITEDPTVVVADSTSLAIGSNNTYKLTDGTAPAVLATVSGLASADYGRIITINAPAVVTNAPTIADNTVFVLVDGVTWTANPGSNIVFQVLDDSTLVEVSRIQTA